jgi:hypothetical protein
MSAGFSLPSRACLASAPDSGDLEDALLVGVLDHRHDQAVRRVGGEGDVEVLLVDQVVAVERGVELRELLQRATQALMMKASMVSFLPDFSFSLFIWTRKASRSVMSASS